MWFLCLCVHKHKDTGAAALKWKIATGKESASPVNCLSLNHR